jgi:N-acetyl sugar amidotransferase
MRPLTVTWSPHLYTDIGRKNLDSFIAAGFDNILITPDGKVHRRMTRLALEELGDPFMPFKYGQVIAPVRIALQFGIKLIFSGENGEAEYTGNPEVWDHPGFKPEDYAKQWFSGVPVEHWLDRGFSKADLALYLPPSMEAIEAAGIERHFYGFYEKWDPAGNYEYATRHTGFQPNPEGRSEGTYTRFSSLDDKIDGFYYRFGYLKYGIGRATSDAAHEVREGRRERDEAVALVRKYDHEFPAKHYQAFLEYTGLSKRNYRVLEEKWANPALVEWRDGEFKARHIVS